MKCIDLFCGVGGSTLGYKMAGFDIILGVDIDEIVLESYHANHPEIEIWQKDIMQLKAEDLPKGADVILGSTPCTSFSIANLKRTCDTTLITYHFLKIISDYKPKYWMLENVPGLAPFLHGVNYNILNAADYGVPQRRKRCIAGKYPKPTPTHFEHRNSTLSGGATLPWVRFGAIKHPDGARIVSKKGILDAFTHTNEMGQKGHSFGLQIIEDKDIVPTICSTEYHGLRGSSIVVWDEGKLRRLSWLECVRAQSFPDDYIFKGTQVQRYHQVGDAVPPLLAKAVAEAIKEDSEK